jgi:vesicle coat complex subunit
MGTIELDRASLPEELDNLKPGQTAEVVVTFKVGSKDDEKITGAITNVETDSSEEADTEDKDDDGMEKSEYDSSGASDNSGETSSDKQMDKGDSGVGASNESMSKPKKGLGVLIMMGSGKGK